MVNNHKPPKFLKRFMINRKGTAEVIGSVLFIVIILFFFSNIYLWHDSQTKTMNNLLSDKLNSQIQVNWLLDNNGKETSTLVVTNTGGVDASLSRLWIVTNSGDHRYASFESTSGNSFSIAAGNTVTIVLSGTTSQTDPIPDSWTGSVATVSFNKADGATFTVLTTLGNMASPEGLIKIVNSGGGGGGGTAPIGSVIVADFQTFSYYNVTATGSKNPTYSIDLSNPGNGYNIQSGGNNVAFSVVLTNNDPLHRTVNLNAYSQMFFINTKNPNNVGYLIFFAINVDTSGKIQQSYSTIDLPYNVPTKVYFAAKQAIVSPTLYVPTNLKTSGQVDAGAYPLNLALLGKFDNTIDFGQNVPFVSIYIVN